MADLAAAATCPKDTTAASVAFFVDGLPSTPVDLVDLSVSVEAVGGNKAAGLLDLAAAHLPPDVAGRARSLAAYLRPR